MNYKSVTKFINENQLIIPIVLVIIFIIYISYTMSMANKKETLDNTNEKTTQKTTQEVSTPVTFVETTPETSTARPLSADHGALANNDYSAVNYPESAPLKSEDLLPKYDEASDFAKENPVSNLLKEQNFLISGYHMGINTVMQSNKIPYHDLRSAPVIPKQNLGPFLNSSYETFGGNSGRRFFELGA